jgi:hypothetical protein
MSFVTAKFAVHTAPLVWQVASPYAAVRVNVSTLPFVPGGVSETTFGALVVGLAIV